MRARIRMAAAAGSVLVVLATAGLEHESKVHDVSPTGIRHHARQHAPPPPVGTGPIPRWQSQDASRWTYPRHKNQDGTPSPLNARAVGPGPTPRTPRACRGT
jgi:hypothetical protein